MSSPISRVTGLLAAGLLVVGCATGFANGGDDRVAMLVKMNMARTVAERSNGAPRETIQYADLVVDALSHSPHGEVKQAAAGHVPSALALLDVAAAAAPDDAPTIWVTKGYLLEVSGDSGGAMKAYETSFAIHPRLSNVVMLTTHLDMAGHWREVAPLCAKARPAIDSTELFNVLDACLYHSHSTTVATGLAWATDEDRALYVAEVKKQAADAQHRREVREAREIAILQARIVADATRDAAATTSKAIRESASNKQTHCTTTAFAGQLQTDCH